MNLSIPTNFIKVSKERFDNCMASCNYSRTGYQGGVSYEARGYVYGDIRIGVTTNDGNYYVNPDFFKFIT